jgi:hypothetical protein
MIEKRCPWCNTVQPARVTRVDSGCAEWECSACGPRWTMALPATGLFQVAAILMQQQERITKMRETAGFAGRSTITSFVFFALLREVPFERISKRGDVVCTWSRNCRSR